MTTFILIAALCLIFTAKSFFMSVLSKRHLRNTPDAILINGFFSACIALAFVAFVPKAGPPKSFSA